MYRPAPHGSARHSPGLCLHRQYVHSPTNTISSAVPPGSDGDEHRTPCGLIPMTEMMCEGTGTLERPPDGTPTGRYAPFALEQHAHCSAMCRASLVRQAEWGTLRTITTLPAAGSHSDTYMMDVDCLRSELEAVGEAAASPSSSDGAQRGLMLTNVSSLKEGCSTLCT